MNLEISVECDSWNKVETKSISDMCAQAVFSELKLNSDSVEICILFTDNREIQLLNNTYRGINKPTNILSFPADLIPENYINDEQIRPCILGSIALAFETVEYETLEQRKCFSDHLKHLIVHGILHLLRYDHIKSHKAEQMEKLEIKILEILNVGNPYE